jgi:2-hydroxy-3-keto-5-methylthiopentenyl-1-phosphate phosphatase
VKKIDYKKITIEKLAAIISEKLKEHAIDSILVGGGCVSIYSQNLYQSYDLDYVTYEDMKKVEVALNELNFQKEGRYFINKDCDYYIEFVSPPVAIGNEPIEHYEYHKTPLGTIKMLTATDSIKDRLAAFYHWDDKQSLDQALTIYKTIPQEIDIEEIRRWSKNEDQLKNFEIFLKHLKNNSNQKF